MKKILIPIPLILISLIVNPSSSNYVPKSTIKYISIDTAKYIGIPYVYGGNSLKGIDCSALVMRIYQDNNVWIARTSWQQSKMGRVVNFKDKRVGDVFVFKNRKNVKIGHVAIYIGNNKVLHAVSKGVKIDSIGNERWEKYYKERFVDVVRIGDD